MSYLLLRGDARRLPIDPREIDAIVTDPPYGIALKNNDRDGHRAERSISIMGDHSQKAGLSVVDLAARYKLPLIMFASPWKPWPGTWRNLIVWNKGGAVGGGGDITRCLKRSWELIQVSRNKPMNGGRNESVWTYMITPTDTKLHIAAKPVALLVELVERFTSRGDLVLDPFMGIGSTGIACRLTGRRFIGLDLDADYVRIAKRRIERPHARVPRPAREEFHPLFPEPQA